MMQYEKRIQSEICILFKAHSTNEERGTLLEVIETTSFTYSLS